MKKSEIKKESRRLGNLLREEEARHKTEHTTLILQLRSIQQLCNHEGQETGSNERDGSWGNPCPTCGYSY